MLLPSVVYPTQTSPLLVFGSPSTGFRANAVASSDPTGGSCCENGEGAVEYIANVSIGMYTMWLNGPVCVLVVLPTGDAMGFGCSAGGAGWGTGCPEL